MRAYSEEEDTTLRDSVKRRSFKESQRPNFATSLEKIEEEFKTITEKKKELVELNKPIDQQSEVEFADEVNSVEGRQKFEDYLKTLREEWKGEIDEGLPMDSIELLEN